MKKRNQSRARQKGEKTRKKPARTETRGQAATEAPAPAPFYVVGVGASAGGLEALRALFAGLPADIQMAFIVVLHLDPKQKSHLADILSRAGKLRVEDATDGAPIAVNHVYVLPSDKAIAVSHGTLQLSPREAGREHHRPVDALFGSLARDRGEFAIGVVLSGSGDDGTQGILEIKTRGGITFAQDDLSARHASMPKSAMKSGAVDFVLSPENIAKELVVLARANAADQATEPQTSDVDPGRREELLTILKGRTNVDFSSYKQTTISRRVHRRMALHRSLSLDDYLSFLKANPNEIDSLYQDILINVTSFFRDPEVFAVLRREVLPKILHKRPADEPVRIWVPGCATGEEAYSLAIIVSEFLSARSLTCGIQIFGTDVNESCVDRARAGIYGERISENVSPARLERFFTKLNRGYQVAKHVRDLCVFARQNVVADPPLSKMDLITCRNLLIYLGPMLQRKAIPRLHYALKPEGYLLLGKSEVVDTFNELFAPVDKRNKLYKKRSSAGSRLLDLGSVPTSARPPTVKRPAPVPAGFPLFDVQQEADRLIASRYSPPALVVTEALDILQFRGDVKPYLELGAGFARMNVEKVLPRELSRALRGLVAGFREGRKGPLSVGGLQVRHNGGVRNTTLRLVPMRAIDGKDRHYLVVFESDGVRKLPARRQASPVPSGDKKALTDEIVRLREEIQITREHLQGTLDESELRNEELQSANEEILSNNEELQTMNQELETSKEELESANEELGTLNEELQNGMEQLRLSEERFRILVSGVKDYAIFMLDPTGTILSWNEGAQRIKGYKSDEVIGRHFSIFYPSDVVRSGKLERELEEAARNGVFQEEGIRVRKGGGEFWAHVILTALYDEDHHVIGYAKVTRDITHIRNAQRALRESERRFRLLVSAVKDYAILMLDRHGIIRSWNEGAQRINGYTAEEAVGQHVSIFYTEHDKTTGKAEREIKIASTEGKFEEEGTRIRKDGTEFIAHVVLTALFDENGELYGFAKVTRDITEKKRADEALARAYAELEQRIDIATRELREKALQLEKQTEDLRKLNSELSASNAELSQFAHVASHDLKEPLRMVKAYVELLQMKYSDRFDAKATEYMGFVTEGASRMHALINDLLLYSSVGKADGGLIAVDLNEAARLALKNLSGVIQESGAQISVGELPTVRGNLSQLTQVLQNLLGNATKFRNETAPHITITSKRENGLYRIEVSDDGIGIDEAYREKIFVIFQRLHTRHAYPGTGIGLAICKKIVERHGGRIGVESAPGKGSTFYFTLHPPS